MWNIRANNWKIYRLKVIAVNKLIEAQARYPSVVSHLRGWYQIVRFTNFDTPEELRRVFGDMRGFNTSYKFPIPESNLLAYTSINFSAKVILIEQIIPGNH